MDLVHTNGLFEDPVGYSESILDVAGVGLEMVNEVV